MIGQIIKQPNGKFCIFSRIIDNVTYSNVTPEQIIEILVAEAREDITDEVNNIIAQNRCYVLADFQHKIKFETMIFLTILNTI